MRLLTSALHPDLPFTDCSALFNADDVITFARDAARAIVLKGEEILLMYTERYHDYTLPGGGIDEGEDKVDALIRELTEETGAQNIRDIEAFGRYEEFRPWHKDDADVVHMMSYCYTCTIDDVLLAPSFEDYEIKNGMKPVWFNIHEAIKHNENTINNSAKKGLSIIRETYLLKRIVEELL